MAALLKLSGAPDLDPALVEPAFVHESAAREGAGPSNERLEFFGDSILGFVASRWLVARYPAANEGELHRRRVALISGDACATTARRLGFPDLVRLGVGMTQTGGAQNATILADAFEAYIAAFFVATDLERTARFIESEHLAHHDRADVAEVDAKSALQEYAQNRFGITPAYFERADGPPQDRRFTSQVRIGAEVVGEGIGPSKKIAQQSAAAMALAHLRSRAPEPEPPPPAPVPPSSRVVMLHANRPRSQAPR